MDERTTGEGESPYVETQVITTVRKYNPNYGDERVCECGHDYYRHFDSHPDLWDDEVMKDVGCKYCECYTFKEVQV